jgi:hypothetical protein
MRLPSTTLTPTKEKAKTIKAKEDKWAKDEDEVVTNPILTSDTAKTLEPIRIVPKEKEKGDNKKANPRITHAPWVIANPKNPAAIAGARITQPEPAINDRMMKRLRRVIRHTNKPI